MMKTKYLIYSILVLVIVGMIFISGCVQNDCASLEKELKTRFNELSKNCSVDDDCTHITVSTGCLAPCPTCVHESENIKLIEDLDNRLRELKCPVQMCAPRCAITICKCINGTCQGIIPSTAKPPEIIIVGGARGDLVEPPPIEEECQQLLEGYVNSADFINKGFTECKLIESKVGFVEEECPSGFSPQGCSICKLECK